MGSIIALKQGCIYQLLSEKNFAEKTRTQWVNGVVLRNYIAMCLFSIKKNKSLSTYLNNKIYNTQQHMCEYRVHLLVNCLQGKPVLLIGFNSNYFMYCLSTMLFLKSQVKPKFEELIEIPDEDFGMSFFVFEILISVNRSKLKECKQRLTFFWTIKYVSHLA